MLNISKTHEHESCMAHVLQTANRKALGFASVPYKKNRFKAGEEIFRRGRQVNAFFAKKFKRQGKLKKIQEVLAEVVSGQTELENELSDVELTISSPTVGELL